MSVRLVNLGPNTAPSGTPLSVYQDAEDGSQTLITTLVTSAPIPPGGAMPVAWELVFPVEDAQGVVLVAGDDGSGTLPADECDLANNTLRWVGPACP